MIEHHLSLGSDGLSPEARYLLEIPTEVLFGKPTSELQYWLNAATASRHVAGDESEGILVLEPPTPTGQVKESVKQSAEPRNHQLGRKAVALAPKAVASISIFLPKNLQRKRSNRDPHRSSPLHVSRLSQRLHCVPSIRRDLVCYDATRTKSSISFIIQIGTLLRSVPDNFHLCLQGGDKVRREAMRFLRPPQWLNDEIIDGYIFCEFFSRM